MDTRVRKKEEKEVKPSPLVRQLVVQAIDDCSFPCLPMLFKEHTPLLIKALHELGELNLNIKFDKISIHQFYQELDKLAKNWPPAEDLEKEIEDFIKSQPMQRINAQALRGLSIEVNAFFQRCSHIREMETIQEKSLSEDEEETMIFQMVERHIDLLRYEHEDTGVVEEIGRLFKNDIAMRDRYLLELLLRIILTDEPQTKPSSLTKEIAHLASQVRSLTNSLSIAGGSHLAGPMLEFMLYVVSPSFQWGARKVGQHFLSDELSKAFAGVEKPKIDRSQLKIGKDRYGLLKELSYRQSSYQTDLLDDTFQYHRGDQKTLILRLTALDYFNKKIQSGDALNPEDIRAEMRYVFEDLYEPMFETRGWGASYITSFVDGLNLREISPSKIAAKPLSFFYQIIDGSEVEIEMKPTSTHSKKAG